MARTEGTCSCIIEDCDHDGDAGVWVDTITGKCRGCEIKHSERWGHKTAKAEEGSQDIRERII